MFYFSLQIFCLISLLNNCFVTGDADIRGDTKKNPFLLDPSFTGIYTILMPKVFHTDKNMTFTVHISTPPMMLDLHAVSSTEPALSQAMQFKLTKTNHLNVKFDPSLFQTKINLVIILSQCKSANVINTCKPVVNETSIMSVAKSKPLLFIESSKPAYRPGEKVQFRCFVIDSMTLASSPTVSVFDKISVEDSRQNLMASWSEVSWHEAFVEGFNFQLTDDPSVGRWKIVARSGSSKYSHTFLVARYTLPRFSVKVVPGRLGYLFTDKIIEYSVCALYSTGRPIKGTLDTVLCLRSYRQKFKCLKKSMLIDAKQKCLQFSHNLAPITALSQVKKYYYGLQWWVSYSAVEDGTGEKQENTVLLGQFSKRNFMLKIIGGNYFHKGLPYYFTIVANDRIGKPISGLNVSCTSIKNWANSGRVFQTDSSGKINLSIYPTTEQKYHISISCKEPKKANPKTISLFPASGYKYTNLLSPPTSPAMQVVPLILSSENMERYCRGHLSIKLQSTNKSGMDHPIKGQLFSKGLTTFLDISDSETWETDSDFKDIFSKSITITIPIDSFMDGVLLLYTFDNKSNIVEDTLNLNILQECLLNAEYSTTSFKFFKKEVGPGQPVSASIKVDGQDAICALKISDINLNQLGKSSNVDMTTLINEYSRYNRANVYFRNIQTDSLYKRILSICNTKYGYFSFDRQRLGQYSQSGLLILSNSNIFDKNLCHSGMYRMAMMMSDASGAMMSSKPIVVRDYFPETWKFEILENPSDTLDLIAPDTLTSWESKFYCLTSKGLGISPNFLLTTFTKFYIQMTLPYSILRKEIVSIPVKIFNYLETCLEVDLEMHTSEDEMLIKSQSKVKVCICGMDQKTVNFKILALRLGKNRIFVIATNTENNFCYIKNNKFDGTSVSDAVERSILVEPEGIPEEYTEGDFICVNKSNKVVTLNVSIPNEIVQDSERGYAVWAGDILGPSLTNLARLVKKPYGCGEQNMVTFVPSIFVLEYLYAMSIEMPEIIKKARLYIQQGYTRQLKYHRKDGSFSAFGDNDKSGSTWLTAFVVRSFIQASRYTQVDSNVLTSAFKFILKQQNKNGCFKEPGRVLHTMMKGASDKNRATLTAYILISLLWADDKMIRNRSHIISQAVSCIELNTPEPITRLSVGSLALRTYALGLDKNRNRLLFNNYKAALLKVKHIENGSIYWAPVQKNIIKDRSRWWDKTRSGEIEATGYALLALMDQQPLTLSLITVRWLSRTQNGNGGWVSTQDTVVGLNSLAKVAQNLSLSSDFQMSVVVKGGGLHQTAIIDKSNRRLTWKKPINVPSLVQFNVTGSGCLIVKANALFNLPESVREEPAFEVDINQTIVNVTKATLAGCTKFNLKNETSNMVVMDVKLLTGWIVNKTNLNELRKMNLTEGGLKRIDESPGKLEFYFDGFNTGDVKCFEISLEQESVVENQENATTTVYDYYDPNLAVEKLYNSDSASFSLLSDGEQNQAGSESGFCAVKKDDMTLHREVEIKETVCRLQNRIIVATKISSNRWIFKQIENDQLLQWNNELIVETDKRYFCINTALNGTTFFIFLANEPVQAGYAVEIKSSMYLIEQSLNDFLNPLNGLACPDQLFIYNSLRFLSNSNKDNVPPVRSVQLSCPFCTNLLIDSLPKTRICPQKLVAKAFSEKSNSNVWKLTLASSKTVDIIIQIEHSCRCNLESLTKQFTEKLVIVKDNLDIMNADDPAIMSFDETFLITSEEDHYRFCA